MESETAKLHSTIFINNKSVQSYKYENKHLIIIWREKKKLEKMDEIKNRQS